MNAADVRKAVGRARLRAAANRHAHPNTVTLCDGGGGELVKEEDGTRERMSVEQALAWVDLVQRGNVFRLLAEAPQW